ncbi:MAG TPA: tetratricopeptide repeat protein [Bacteroidales bacterium]|nr:tetratricopeptide repeat protein [Bacteroidales bacterium]HRZ49607.1 tetratricopeptide repeat protein [Bacteroidales bacterium]
MSIKWLVFVIGMLAAVPLSSQIHLYLLVNSTTQDTMCPGEPVVLDISISNANAEYREMCNQAILKNLEGLRKQLADQTISKEYFDKEEAILISSIHPVSGIPVSISSLIASAKVIMNGDTLQKNSYIVCDPGSFMGDTVLLDAKQRIHLTFGFTSEATQKWSRDVRRFRVSLDSMESNVAEVTVLKKLPSSMLPADRLIKAGYFSLRCGNPQDAVQIADRILASDPHHLAALILKADADLALQLPDHALEVYQHALEMFYLKYPDEYEPPDYLLQQIRALEILKSDR